ncbi:MAG: PDZ domain-containing protein, partial [Planctomycetota bacterium]
HSLEYWGEEKPFLIDFMHNNVRNPFPAKLSLETDNMELRRVHWVQIDEIKNINNNSEMPDYNIIITPTRVRLGIYPDQEYDGEGVKVKEIEKESLADKLSIQSGDIIVQIDDKEFENLNELMRVIREKKPGDKIDVKIKRDENIQDFTGQFEQFKPQPVFIRDKPSGRLEVIVNNNRIDVKVKNISRYSILISKSQFDIDKKIEVYTNNELSFKGKIKPDLKFMLEQAIRDKDRTMIFRGKIDIEVKQK